MNQPFSYVHQLYKKVCLAYAIEPDEDGVSVIERLKIERLEIGKKSSQSYRKFLSVAEMKFLRFDCVFISAERSAENGGTEKSNKENTELLRRDLLVLQNEGFLNFYDSEGEYLEIGSNIISHEKGFFCTDLGPKTAAAFFTKMFKLSEKYNQDSFLYKSAGGRLTRTGFFIATNDAALKQYTNGYWKAGELYIDLPPEGYWSESDTAFGGKRIFFKCEKPPQEDLDYCQHS